MSQVDQKLVFGAEKHPKRLDHFIWSCTRAYDVKHAFSLGDGKPLPNEPKIRTLADRNNLKGKCGTCEFKIICGGCRARAYIYSKGSLNQDPACVYRPARLAIDQRFRW